MTDQLRAKMKAAIEAEVERQDGLTERGLYLDEGSKGDPWRVIDGWIDVDALAEVVAARLDGADRSAVIREFVADGVQKQQKRRT